MCVCVRARMCVSVRAHVCVGGGGGAILYRKACMGLQVGQRGGVCVCDAQFFQIMLKLRGSTMCDQTMSSFVLLPCRRASGTGLR